MKRQGRVEADQLGTTAFEIRPIPSQSQRGRIPVHIVVIGEGESTRGWLTRDGSIDDAPPIDPFDLSNNSGRSHARAAIANAVRRASINSSLYADGQTETATQALWPMFVAISMTASQGEATRLEASSIVSAIQSAIRSGALQLTDQGKLQPELIG